MGRSPSTPRERRPLERRRRRAVRGGRARPERCQEIGTPSSTPAGGDHPPSSSTSTGETAPRERGRRRVVAHESPVRVCGTGDGGDDGQSMRKKRDRDPANDGANNLGGPWNRHRESRAPWIPEVGSGFRQGVFQSPHAVCSRGRSHAGGSREACAATVLGKRPVNAEHESCVVSTLAFTLPTHPHLCSDCRTQRCVLGTRHANRRDERNATE